MNWFIPALYGLLLVLLDCEGASHQKPAPPLSKLSAAPKPQAVRELAALDTAAILGNYRLDHWLAEAQKTPLVAHRSSQALPAGVRSFLERITGETFTLANPGEKYQETDVVYERGLPARQLVYLGVGDSLVLMAYYLGGYGVSERVMLFKMREQKVVDFWTGFVRGKGTTKEHILQYLQEYKDRKWGVNTNIIYF
jgi:hypothetical protein